MSRKTQHPLPPLAALAVLCLAGAGGPADPASGRDSVQDLMFLGDDRPVFLRLHLSVGAKGFRTAWLDFVRSLHTDLDRDGNGKVTTAEVDRSSFPGLVRAMTGGAATAPRIELDGSPKDGIITVDELAEALLSSVGPFGVVAGRVASQQTDALFGQVDRNGDGSLIPAELDAAKSLLARFDLDDDEQLDRDELDPFSDPLIPLPDDDPNRRGRYAGVPPIVELTPEDPSFRPVRQLLKKYDKPARPGTAAGDNMLSRAELGIDPKSFAAADTDNDSRLDTEELRRYLARVAPEIEVRVKLSESGGNSATASIEASGPGGKPLPANIRLQRLSPSDIEIALDEIHLEFHAEQGDQSVQEATNFLNGQFRMADADTNNYVEKAETAKRPTVLTSLFELIDRDGDGKLYPKELDGFIDRQSAAARGRMTLATADQGRAIFAILDLNRDGRIGLREIRDAPARVMSWDLNRDGRIASDEIPHHYQFTIGRGQVSLPGVPYSLGTHVVSNDLPKTPTMGPAWFRKMDHNRDGDISRREFFGPAGAFDRLDGDHDGLISAAEAAGAK